MAIGDSPTIIVGHLNDEELKKSIDSLVAHVAEGTQKMVNNFNTSIDAMKNKLKELGSVKVDVNAPQGSATGSGKNSPAVDASAQRTAAQKKETAATKETALTYDQLEVALKRAQKVVNDFASKKTFSTEDLDKYTAALTKVAQLREKLNQSKAGVAMTNALANEKTWAFDAKKINEMSRQSDELKKLNRLYAEEEKAANKAAQAQTKRAEQEAAANQKRIATEQKYQDTVLKNAMKNALSMPTGNIDQVNAKIREIQFLLDNLRNKGIFSQVEINRAVQALDKLREKSRDLQEQQRRTAEQPQIGQTSTKSARESYIAFMKGYREQAEQLSQLIKTEESRLLQEQSARVAALGQQITQNNAKIQELRSSLQQLAQEEKNASSRYGVKDGYRAAIQQTNDEINKLIAKNKELEAEQKRVASTDPLKQQGGTLDELRAKREKVLNIMREEVSTQQQVAASTQQSTAAAKEYSEQVRRIAAEVRAGAKWQTADQMGFHRGIANIDGRAMPVMENLQMGITLEGQIEQAIQRVNQERERGVTITRQQSEEDKKAAELLGWVETKTKKKYETPSIRIEHVSDVRRALQTITGMQEKWVDEINKAKSSYSDLANYVKQLKGELLALPKGVHDDAAKVLIREIQQAEREMDKFQQTMKRPVSLKDALSGSEKTLDDITYKIRQLQSYKRGIDLTDPKQIAELKQVDAAINRLQKDLNKYMSTTKQATELNKALARSWNYMKNRLAFYFTVGASTQFVKNLIDIRSQYEMNERALGILINSAERGTQIFNELSQMALVSPYTLIELSTAAKQLTAYDIAARDVVDTTRRLADMAAAVGIPIDRLTYALGQIKAYGYLNARDARMFSNAGIPLVKQLSDYYTELEGRMVSVADVYDRIKKKTIDFNTVMSVMYKMTDEGGKFFDFQAKMADTLKVRLANLTLAWNNMLNDMGKETQGLISFSIDLLKKLFLHWKQVDHALKQVGAIVGLRFAIMLLGNALLKMGVKPLQRFAASLTLTSIAGKRLAMVLTTMGKSLAALLLSPTTWIMVAVMWFAELASAIWNANQATEEFNKNLRDSAKTTYDELAKFLGEDVNVRMRNELDKGDIAPTEASKAWENVREQIELSSRNSEEFVQHLLSIQNESERLRQGFALLDKVSAVNAAIKEMDDTTIKITQDWSKWWNLWKGADGLVGNLDDYVESLKKYQEYHKSGLRDSYDKEFWKDQQDDLETLKKDVDALTESIDNFINLKGWSGDIDKINEAYSKIIGNVVEQNQISPEKAFRLQLITEEARANAAKKALSIRIEDEKNALAKAADENAKIEIQARLNALNEEYVHFAENNGRGKVLWEEYTTWLKEQHISETREMFRGMDAEEIAKIDFSKGKWKEFAETTANKFAREHNLATDDVFTLLNNWVKNANKWSIFIPLVISSEGDKSLYDTLKEYDSQIDKADGEIDRLNKRINKLNKKKSLTADEQKELTRAQKERDEAQKERDEALAKGGISKKDEKEAQKDAKKSAADARKRERAAAAARRQEESELQKTLKEELSLIDKIRSTYKDLTKEGMNHADAVNLATNGYEKTVEEINKVFAKWGIEAFDPKKFAGVANPAEIMTMLSNQLKRIQETGRAKPSEIKDLEVKIQSLNVDAKKYDLTKITKGLNSELDKLKDEYELAVELDADPELGNAFADMMGINIESLPHTVKEYADRYSTYLNKYLKGKNSSLQFTGDELRGLTRDDITAFREQVDAGSFNQEWFDAILKAYEDISGKRKKDLEETEKWKNSLIEKYGNLQDKLTKIYKDSVQQQVNAVKSFGTEDQKSEIVRLQLRLEATDDPAELANINLQIAEIVKDVTDKNPIALKLVTASGNQTKADTSKAYWEDFKNSELYTMTFEDMANNSTRAIQLIMDKLEGLKDKVKEDPASMKALIKSLEDAENELNTRDPFGGVARSLKAMAEASGEVKDAQDELAIAERNVEIAQQKAGLAKNGTPAEQKKAQEALAAAVKKRANAQVKLAQAEGKGKKAQENLKSSLQGITSELNNVKELFDTVSKLFRAGGDNETADAIDAISEGFSIMTTVIMGVVAAMILLESSQPWLLAIAAALSVIVGLVSFISNHKDKKITKEIDKSKRRVEKLKQAYDELQHTIEKSMASAEIAARKAAIENKRLELEELKRQLALEKSRKGKHRDEDAIISLEGEVAAAKRELQDLTDEISTTLLGSDIKSAAENFVSTWVSAWRQGEDVMESLGESFDSMIDTMIMKSLASKLVANRLQPIWDMVNQITDANSAGGTAITLNELEKIRNLIGSKSIAEGINEDLTRLYGALGIMYGDGNVDKNLSALQQGIQGITEDQAGALEAYWNANTQQQYVHTDLLTQIRDTIIGFDLDVQTANIGQILLQLQASYQVQMSIQSILEGVLNPSGRAFNVELLS